jgi:hypothetical protein
VQFTGHDHPQIAQCRSRAGSAPDHFQRETPTAVLVRQVLGVVAPREGEPGGVKAARDRRLAQTG